MHLLHTDILTTHLVEPASNVSRRRGMNASARSIIGARAPFLSPRVGSSTISATSSCIFDHTASSPEGQGRVERLNCATSAVLYRQTFESTGNGSSSLMMCPLPIAVIFASPLSMDASKSVCGLMRFTSMIPSAPWAARSIETGKPLDNVPVGPRPQAKKL